MYGLKVCAFSCRRDFLPPVNSIPMTTTPTDPPSGRDEKGEELDRLLAEDSPRGEQLRRLRDLVRTDILGLEPLCPECEGADESEGDSEQR